MLGEDILGKVKPAGMALDQPPTISLPHNVFTEKFIKPIFNAQGICVLNKTTNTLGAALFLQEI